MGKSTPSKKALLNLCAREDWICWLCGGEIPMEFEPMAPHAPSRDHVIPRVQLKQIPLDQRQYQSNIRLAHRFCNSDRQDRAFKVEDREKYAARLAQAVEEYELGREIKEGRLSQEVERVIRLSSRIRIRHLSKERRVEGIEEAKRIAKN